MLTESIVVSNLRPDKIPSHLQNKDVGIFFYDLAPSATLKAALKKSSTRPNCLAVSETHAFAAQADKAAVHVYNLSKGNQECLVPFPEKITSLALIGRYGDAGILALGTEGGKVLFWELATGRQLSTGAAHLQSIPCMVVDPSQNYLITGSPDSTVLVWSIPACLSFTSVEDPYSDQSSPFAPIHSLTNHRGPVTCLSTGHSCFPSNFVISGSEDKSCLIWDYRTGQLLHTFLLSFVPRCITVDPADRAFYVGSPDGSIQPVHFHKRPRLEHVANSNGTDTVTESDAADKWPYVSDEPSEVLSLALSYDGTRALSGHQNGQLLSWDMASGRLSKDKVAEVIGPLTNIVVRPIKGFASIIQPEMRLLAVVKPKSEFPSGTSSGQFKSVPDAYTFTAQFHRPLPLSWGHQESENCCDRGEAEDPLMEGFHAALSHAALPPEMMEEEIASVLGPDLSGQSTAPTNVPAKAEQDMKKMQALLEASSKSYLAAKGKVDELAKEVLRLREEEQDRLRRRRILQARRLREPINTDAGEMEFDRNEALEGESVEDDV